MPADEEPLQHLGDPGHDPQRDHGTRDQPDRRRGDEQGIQPEGPAGVDGQRRAVQPQLGERDHRDRHEGDVEAEPLRQARPALAGVGGAGAGRAGGHEQRRQGEDDDGHRARDHRRDDRGSTDRDVVDEAEPRDRADRAEERDEADRQQRRDGRGGDGEEDGLQQGHPGQVGGTRAPRAEERDLGPAPLDEQAGDEQDRVAREDHELDRHEGDPAAADEDAPADLDQRVGQGRRDPRLRSARQVAAQPRLERRQARSQRIDIGDAEGAEIGQAAPLHVDPVRSGDAQQVRLADHDRASGREGPAGRRAGRLERVAPRPGGRRIGVPEAGDDRVDARARVLPADQRQAVPDVDPEGRGRRVGRRRLDGRAVGLRPGTVDEGRLALDAVEALEDREIRDLVRRRGGVGEAARPDGAEDVAAGRRHRVREGRPDDGVHVGQVGRVGREGHDHRSAGRRLVEERAVEPAAGDGVAVDDARRKQRRRADQQQQCGKDHRPIGEAALHDRACQAGPGGHVRYGSPARIRRRRSSVDTPPDRGRFTPGSDRRRERGQG